MLYLRPITQIHSAMSNNQDKPAYEPTSDMPPMHVADPAVAYETSTYNPALDTYNYPADYPWAPRTQEELDRWIAKINHQMATGQYSTAEESNREIMRRLAQRRCK